MLNYKPMFNAKYMIIIPNETYIGVTSVFKLAFIIIGGFAIAWKDCTLQTQINPCYPDYRFQILEHLVSHLISLSLSFTFFKMGIIMLFYMRMNGAKYENPSS